MTAITRRGRMLRSPLQVRGRGRPPRRGHHPESTARATHTAPPRALCTPRTTRRRTGGIGRTPGRRARNRAEGIRPRADENRPYDASSRGGKENNAGSTQGRATPLCGAEETVRKGRAGWGAKKQEREGFPPPASLTTTDPPAIRRPQRRCVFPYICG